MSHEKVLHRALKAKFAKEAPIVLGSEDKRLLALASCPPELCAV